VIGYLTAILTLVGVRALLTLGLNVQWGLTGLVNLGAVAFFAVGAYTSALLAVGGVSLLLAWPAGVVLAAVAGAALALVALRLREDYLAIVTLGFAEVLRLFLLNEAWLTRGANGVTAIPRPLHAWFPGQYDLFYLILVLVAVGLVYAVLERVRRSPFGRVLRAIREDAQVAAFAGKDVLRFKVKAFALGGALAGLAGALYAHYSSYIVPEIYVPLLTIYIFLALTAGGIGNNLGAVIGAFVVVFFLESTRFLIGVIPWLTAEQLAALREFLVGLGLLLVLFFRPRGLVPEPLPRLAKS